MKASDNETVEDIIAINRAIYQGCEECSLSDKDVKWFLDLIDRIEAAWKREKGELVRINENLHTHFDVVLKMRERKLRSCNNCPNGKCWIVDATAALAKASGESEVENG